MQSSYINKRINELSTFNLESQASSKSKDSPPLNVFLLVFVLLVEAMNTTQETVVAQSKQLAANAAEQSALNDANNQLQFEQIHSGAVTQGTINKVQAYNEEISKQREDIQNNLILARQIAQVEMTDTNATVGQAQQSASEDTGWLSTLNSVGQSIVQMNQAQ